MLRRRDCLARGGGGGRGRTVEFGVGVEREVEIETEVEIEMVEWWRRGPEKRECRVEEQVSRHL